MNILDLLRVGEARGPREHEARTMRRVSSPALNGTICEHYREFPGMDVLALPNGAMVAVDEDGEVDEDGTVLRPDYRIGIYSEGAWIGQDDGEPVAFVTFYADGRVRAYTTVPSD